MTKKKKIILIVAAVLTVAAIAVSALLIHQAKVDAEYRAAHVFVGDTAYPRDAESLDLRGTHISLEEYEAIRSQLPECEILWDVPFQGGFYSCDTTEITIDTLSDGDVILLDYLPQLQTVHAEGCTDYPQLIALQERRSSCTVHYQVTLNGGAYPGTTTALEFTEADGAQLLEMLQYLTALETVHFTEPELPTEELLALREAYPDVVITWEKTLFGTTYPDNVTELDFSGIVMETVDEVEAAMHYFPDLEMLVMCNCGIDNDTMYDYRNRAREDYKVVWSVMINTFEVRTDVLTFMPVRERLHVDDGHLNNLFYCEDLVCVDLGHRYVSNLDWLYGTPHMKYLVLADTQVVDITPIGTLKELIYLELFKTSVNDYSPLVGCTALEDVNVAFSKGDPAVFAQMPWLKNLWVNGLGMSDETRQLLSESLPDTHMEIDSGWHMGGSWRGVENYFRMRDVLEMPYYDWGNYTGRPEWANDEDRTWTP